MILLTIIEIALYVILAFNVGYLLVFALASKLPRRRHHPDTTEFSRILVLFPAYKEDGVILSSTRTFLQQEYPRERYDVIVISDQMQDATNEALRQLPIRLLIADYKESSKAKAMMQAMKATAGEDYDIVVIMDADNTAAPDFLREINKAFQAGCHAIQTHRTAKNLNTDVAVLDAASEEINNSIFRSGHVALGLSSALIGSGMALDAHWFRQHVKMLETAGEDKELEALLLKQGIRIEYLEHVYVKDEKTQKKEGIKNQRKRWIAAQFDSLAHALPDFPKALLAGKIDYCDKIVQWTLLPRVILLAGVFFCSALATVVSPYASLKWWGLSLALVLALFIAIPSRLLNKRLLKAVLQLPILILMIAGNLFHLKGVNKKFIHTEHGSN